MSHPSTSRPRIVILGGGYAGLTAADRLARSKVHADITLVDAKPEFLERIRLHQVAAGQALGRLPYKAFLQQRGISFVQARITALDPDRRMVTVEDASCGPADVPFDYLVYALGSAMHLDGVPGVKAHAYSLESLDAAQRMAPLLAGGQAQKVLVVGGGITAIETAAELAESFPRLHLTLAAGRAFTAERVAGGFSQKAIDYLHQTFERLHITLRTEGHVTMLTENSAHLADGGTVPFDACIWTSGFVPSPLAATTRIRVNDRGQIVTDASLRSVSHPHVIAIGDAAAASTSNGACRMSCATALPMATAGARTLAAMLADRAPPAFKFGYLFRNISLGRKDGLIQFTDRQDRPRNLIWTGEPAARWKEYICAGTLATVGFYPTRNPPVMPPLRMLPQLLESQGQYA